MGLLCCCLAKVVTWLSVTLSMIPHQLKQSLTYKHCDHSTSWSLWLLSTLFTGTIRNFTSFLFLSSKYYCLLTNLPDYLSKAWFIFPWLSFLNSLLRHCED